MSRTVEKTLKRLQAAARRPSPPGAPHGMSFRVPDDLATSELRTVVLTREEHGLYELAAHEMTADLRFEYLKRRILDRELERLICLALVDRATDQVPILVSRLAREVVERSCYFQLLHLKVLERREIAGIRLLPLDDPDSPTISEPWSNAAAGGYIEVPVSGTNWGLMAKRARLRAEHTLRLLRVTMRSHPSIHDQQLRFSLGEAYTFGNGAEGWASRDDVPYEVGLDREVWELITKQSKAHLAFSPDTDVESRALLAVEWIERSRLAIDPLLRVLYAFFALEAILGDTAEGLKAHGLVFRRMVLSSLSTGAFSNPVRLFELYDQVRSRAVHGSEPPTVSGKMASSLEWEVRTAINEYLTFAKDRGLKKRSHVNAALIAHEEATPAIEWLRSVDSRWEDYDPWAAPGKRN